MPRSHEPSASTRPVNSSMIWILSTRARPAAVSSMRRVSGRPVVPALVQAAGKVERFAGDLRLAAAGLRRGDDQRGEGTRRSARKFND